MPDVGAFTPSGARFVGDQASAYHADASKLQPERVRNPHRLSGKGGSAIEADFKLTAALAQSAATGTAEVVACPARPSLVGQTITVQNIPESGGGYIFFGAIDAQGRATENTSDGTWWIENMECIPEEPPLNINLLNEGDSTTAAAGEWVLSLPAGGF